jgi:hypothetical protein
MYRRDTMLLDDVSLHLLAHSHETAVSTLRCQRTGGERAQQRRSTAHSPTNILMSTTLVDDRQSHCAVLTRHQALRAALGTVRTHAVGLHVLATRQRTGHRLEGVG